MIYARITSRHAGAFGTPRQGFWVYGFEQVLRNPLNGQWNAVGGLFGDYHPGDETDWPDEIISTPLIEVNNRMVEEGTIVRLFQQIVLWGTIAWDFDATFDPPDWGEGTHRMLAVWGTDGKTLTDSTIEYTTAAGQHSITVPDRVWCESALARGGHIYCTNADNDATSYIEMGSDFSERGPGLGDYPAIQQGITGVRLYFDELGLSGLKQRVVLTSGTNGFIPVICYAIYSVADNAIVDGITDTLATGDVVTGGLITAKGSPTFVTLSAANTFTNGQTINSASATPALNIQQTSSNSSDTFRIRNTSGTTTFNVTGGGDVTGNSFTGSGSGLTSLNASNLGSGTIPSARIGTVDGGTW